MVIYEEIFNPDLTLMVIDKIRFFEIQTLSMPRNDRAA